MSKTGSVSIWLLKIAVILAVINPVLSIWILAESSFLFGFLAWLAGGLVIVGVGLAGVLGASRSSDRVSRLQDVPAHAEQPTPAGRGHSIAV